VCVCVCVCVYVCVCVCVSVCVQAYFSTEIRQFATSLGKANFFIGVYSKPVSQADLTARGWGVCLVGEVAASADWSVLFLEQLHAISTRDSAHSSDGCCGAVGRHSGWASC
jgi:hypothetical protein